jgi:hypothetical protein
VRVPLPLPQNHPTPLTPLTPLPPDPTTTSELIHHQAILLEWSIHCWAEGEDWERYLDLARQRFEVMIRLSTDARKVALDSKRREMARAAVV